jgi:dTDP-4-dehydrorhamnose 3,5-epimerase-like enzyme
MVQKLIHGVETRDLRLRKNIDSRGWLSELVRESDYKVVEDTGIPTGYSLFNAFDKDVAPIPITKKVSKNIPIKQTYITQCDPGVVKGMHRHRFQIDRFVALRGKFKVILVDTRHDSPTFGEINEFVMQDTNLSLLIPQFVQHGFKNIGKDEAIMINHPSEEYNHQSPDEERFNWEGDFYVDKKTGVVYQEKTDWDINSHGDNVDTESYTNQDGDWQHRIVLVNPLTGEEFISNHMDEKAYEIYLDRFKIISFGENWKVKNG